MINHIGICIDITDRKAKEERIRFPGPARCADRAAQPLAVPAAPERGPGPVPHHGRADVVLFIDLTASSSSTTPGHHIGDGLLRQVARRLVKAVRDTDTVSRPGR